MIKGEDCMTMTPQALVLHLSLHQQNSNKRGQQSQPVFGCFKLNQCVKSVQS